MNVTDKTNRLKTAAEIPRYRRMGKPQYVSTLSILRGFPLKGSSVSEVDEQIVAASFIKNLPNSSINHLILQLHAKLFPEMSIVIRDD